MEFLVKPTVIAEIAADYVKEYPNMDDPIGKPTSVMAVVEFIDILVGYVVSTPDCIGHFINNGGIKLSPEQSKSYSNRFKENFHRLQDIRESAGSVAELPRLAQAAGNISMSHATLGAMTYSAILESVQIYIMENWMELAEAAQELTVKPEKTSLKVVRPDVH